MCNYLSYEAAGRFLITAGTELFLPKRILKTLFSSTSSFFFVIPCLFLITLNAQNLIYVGADDIGKFTIHAYCRTPPERPSKTRSYRRTPANFD